MVRVVVVAALVLLSALTGTALAVCQSCVFAVSASATGDLVQVVNAGSSNTISFQIYDDAGALQGSAAFTIDQGKRLVKKVGEIYAAALVPSSAIKSTWFLAVEANGTSRMEMQVRTGGGSFDVPQSDANGSAGSCH